MADSLRASAQGLAVVDRARRRKGWTKTWTSAWWEAAYTSQATVRRFWRGLAIQRENFIAICQAVGIEDWQAIAADPEVPEPGDETPVLTEAAQPWAGGEENSGAALQGAPATLLELPEGPVRLGSALYLERPPIERRCYQTLAQPGALIRIKAPRQMGKTSLLNRILAEAGQQGYRTVRLNLLQAEASALSSLDRFLRWFCLCLGRKLHLEGEVDDFWQPGWGSVVSCTAYVQERILEGDDRPFCLALDEADRVFQFPDVTQGFFPMLRSWHEEAKTMAVWERLRLVVAHSTEDYGMLDINQSPFNVGLPVELTEFSLAQVEDLAGRHDLDLTQASLQALMSRVGGHPYLIRLALYHLACGDLTLEQLLLEAASDAGIYEHHLRRHWMTLKEQPELAAAFHQAIAADEPIQLKPIAAYQLYRMGLIQRQRDRALPRCQLYQQYFQERLAVGD